MKNIAIVNSCHTGSTGKIVSGLHRYLQKLGYNSFLCYGRGEKYIDDTCYRIDSKFELYTHALMTRILGDQGCYSTIATKRLIKELKHRQIDTIYGVGLHGYYLNERMFFDYINENNIRFIYVMTEEYPFLGRCGYNNGCENFLTGCGNCPQLKEYPRSLFFDRSRKIFNIKKNAYSKLKRTIFAGPEFTIVSSKKSPLMEGIRTEIVDEAIDLSLYYPRDSSQLRAKLGIPDDKIVIVCVAPWSYGRKGCIYFLEAARQLEQNQGFIFVHVGYTADVNQCPKNYIPIPYEYDQSILSEYYSIADLFVFPSLLDTMPNACLEALACGSPLLCFDISGMPYIADNMTATFVEAKNVDKMVEVILKTKKKNQNTIDTCRKYAEKRYDNQKYYQRLLEIAELIK